MGQSISSENLLPIFLGRSFFYFFIIGCFLLSFCHCFFSHFFCLVVEEGAHGMRFTDRSNDWWRWDSKFDRVWREFLEIQYTENVECPPSSFFRQMPICSICQGSQGSAAMISSFFRIEVHYVRGSELEIRQVNQNVFRDHFSWTSFTGLDQFLLNISLKL